MPDATEAQEIPKTKRPSDSAFKQQKLPAWQPILTAGTVLPTFFVIGIAFIPVGIALLYFSNAITEFVYDYTDCAMANAINSTWTCADYIKNNPGETCKCIVPFTLEKDFIGKVYLYYGLSNYYQNHRRYVKSRDDDQLLGRLETIPSSDCDPFRYDDKGNPIAPCGAIANSLFSDRFELKSNDYGPVNLLKTEIAWPSDKQIKFRNPQNLTIALEGFVKPKAWKYSLLDLDPEHPDNNGFQNEDLIVWMRTAALPNFRKLHRRIDHSQKYFDEGLRKGNYTLTIHYSYSVKDFEGSKKFILSTTSLLGGKNPFLGFAYIIVGSVCLLLGIVLLIIHIKFSKNTSGINNVTPRTPYS